MVSIRSEFQTIERSATRMSSVPFQTSWMSWTPSWSTGPSRNTAQLFCITRCMRRRSSDVAVPPLAWRNLSRRDSDELGGVLRQLGLRGARFDGLAATQAGGAAEHDEVDQRVGAEAVGAVDRHAGGFAQRHQAGHDRVRVAVLQGQNLAVIVRGDAAHVVVHGRQHRDRLAAQVDAGEHLGVLGDAGQTLGQDRGIEVVEVEVDVVLAAGRQPRPSRISIVMQRETTSREARSLKLGA